MACRPKHAVDGRLHERFHLALASKMDLGRLYHRPFASFLGPDSGMRVWWYL